MEAPIEPFAPPAEPNPTLKRLDLKRAASDGFLVIYLNMGAVALVTVVGALAHTVASITLLGLIPTLPALLWSSHRFLLDMADGRVRVANAWRSAKDLDHSFGPMWGVFLLYGALYVPILVWVAVLSLILNEGGAWKIDLGLSPVDPLVFSALTKISFTLYSLLLVRFVFATFLLVEGRPMGVRAAFAASWRATSGSWPQLMAIQLLCAVLALPAGAVALISLTHPDASLPTQLMHQCAKNVLLAFGWLGPYTLFALSYRQLVGRISG